MATPRRRSARLSATPEPVALTPARHPPAPSLQQVPEEAAPKTPTRTTKKEEKKKGDSASSIVRRKRKLAARLRLGALAHVVPPLLVLAGYLLPLAWPLPPPGPWYDRQANNGISKGTYVDENALQPAQAFVYYDYDHDVRLADAIASNLTALGASETRSNAAQRAYLVEQLVALGLRPHVQDYRYTGTQVSGKNVFCRFSSPRTDAREAFVLAASWQSSLGTFNVRGIATVVSLARALTTQAHLARDVLFVVSDGHLDGMHAWLAEYYAQPQANLISTTTPDAERGSVLWNALAFDYPSDSFAAIEVLHEGLDGQLPNQDALNAVVTVIEHTEGIPARLPGVPLAHVWDALARIAPAHHWWSAHAEGEYKAAAERLVRQFGIQAAGATSGLHGLFTKYHVDAVTLRAVPADGPYGFWHMGRVAEGSFRAFNNLLERLHHSQFFYLLPTHTRFVPFGVYVPASVLISVGLSFLALLHWARLGARLHTRQTALVAVHAAVENDAMLERPPAEHLLLAAYTSGAAIDTRRLAAELRQQARPIGFLLVAVATSLAAGLAALGLLARAPLDCHPAHCKPLRLATLLLGSAAVVVALLGLAPRRPRRDTARAMHVVAMLHAALLIAVLSVVHFAQAYAAALLLGIPLALGLALPGFLRVPMYATLLPGIAVALAAPDGVLQRLLWDHTILGTRTIPFVCVGYAPVLVQALAAALLDL